jgi:hypothetical protein
MRFLALLLLVTACHGKDDTTTGPAPQATCDDLTAEPLGSVPVEEWPEGFPDALERYRDLGGRYDATLDEACGGGTVGIKLIPRGQEELLLVTEPWPAASVLTCGCVTDPVYEDDTAYDIAAQIPEFEIFVETFGEVGLDNQNLVGSGALFNPSAAAPAMRACGTKDVNPILGSIYEQFTVIVRVEDSGLLTGTITLAQTDGTNSSCDLTDWELVEGL